MTTRCEMIQVGQWSEARESARSVGHWTWRLRDDFADYVVRLRIAGDETPVGALLVRFDLLRGL